MIPTTNGYIPSTFLITFEVTFYLIFSSTESLLCFRCKQCYLEKDCPLTKNSHITDTTTYANISSTIPTSFQSSKLPTKKITITTEINIHNSKHLTKKLSTEQPQNILSPKIPQSQSSADEKPEHVNRNDIHTLPPPTYLHKENNRNNQTNTKHFPISSFRFRRNRVNVSPSNGSRKKLFSTFPHKLLPNHEPPLRHLRISSLVGNRKKLYL